MGNKLFSGVIFIALIISVLILWIAVSSDSEAAAKFHQDMAAAQSFIEVAGGALICGIPALAFLRLLFSLGGKSSSENSDHTVAEYNSDGTIIAYRWFRRDSHGNLYSVTRNDKYEGGWLTADRVPTMKNSNGVYAAKTPNSPVLDEYNNSGNVLCRVELGGKYIEGETGYRAQHCRVIEIIRENEPQSYPNYDEYEGG